MKIARTSCISFLPFLAHPTVSAETPTPCLDLELPKHTTTRREVRPGPQTGRLNCAGMSHGPSPVPLTEAWSGPAAKWHFREDAFTLLPQYASPSPTASLSFVLTVCSGSSNHVSFGVPSGCGHLRYVPLGWERGHEGGPWTTLSGLCPCLS